ncbi:MAG TPA: hypothetical protein VGS07_07350 [Thermoanaerobaculia bacterium]|jgi:hypothetical protein|nr:hypothetical protein [Thermoanaerobaculia bacterium]
MTISFLTLFFGLISGSFPVALTVSGPVAAIELTVDGGVPSRLAAPPWNKTVDFGAGLAPHRIVARALDAEDHELARTEEWVNLPHSQAKAEIILEGGKDGPPRAARVVWANVLGERLESVALSFDGRRLRLDQAQRATLPKHDLKTLHILTARVRFRSNRLVRKDVAYGGEYGSEVATELTAVPVHVSTSPLPPPQQLRGWFTAGGQELSVAAVEDGPGQLFVVRVPSSSEDTRKVGKKGLLPADIQFDMRLGKEDSFRFVHPYPEVVEGKDQVAELFNLSGEKTYKDGGLAFWLRAEGIGAPAYAKPLPSRYTVEFPDAGTPIDRREMRIAEAVAVAGLKAMEENRRRAVLLVLNGDELEDYSRYDADTVRRFLAALRVPLYVWTLGKAAPGSFATSWGPTVEVDEVQSLYHAVDSLRQELRSQRIVLLDGRLLPQSVALGPAARDVELAGSTGR